MNAKSLRQLLAPLPRPGLPAGQLDRYETATGTRYAGIWRQNSSRPDWALSADVDARWPSSSTHRRAGHQCRGLPERRRRSTCAASATPTSTTASGWTPTHVGSVASVSKAVGRRADHADGGAGPARPRRRRPVTWCRRCRPAHPHRRRRCSPTAAASGTTARARARLRQHSLPHRAGGARRSSGTTRWSAPVGDLPLQHPRVHAARGRAGGRRQRRHQGPGAQEADQPVRPRHPRAAEVHRSPDVDLQSPATTEIDERTTTGRCWAGARVLGDATWRFGAKLIGGQILSDDSLDTMWTPPNTVSSYAYGWSTGTEDGTQVVAKNGSWTGNLAYLRLYPEKGISVAVLMNSRDKGASTDPRPGHRRAGPRQCRLTPGGVRRSQVGAVHPGGSSTGTSSGGGVG